MVCKGRPNPAIIAEHENYSQGIRQQEIPKLLASNAELKVLICYPPPDNHDDIANELLRTLQNSERVGKLPEEFLLILGRPGSIVKEPKEFAVYWYHQDYVLNVIRKPWFALGSGVYWDAGDGWVYSARILGYMKNGVKVKVVAREWKGSHVQETKMQKLEPFTLRKT